MYRVVAPGRVVGLPAAATGGFRMNWLTFAVQWLHVLLGITWFSNATSSSASAR